MLSYPKVNAQHKIGQESILSGPVVLEEKTDGSMIRIKITPDSMEFGSRRVEFNNRGIDSTFTKGVETFEQNNPIGKHFGEYTEFSAVHLFGEYFKSEKQNTIKYNRIPKNHIMLFDVAIEDSDGRLEWCNNLEINSWAKACEIESVPVLYEGEDVTLEQIKKLSEEESILGGAKREGVVIKNRKERYNTKLLSLQEHPFQLAKNVRPEFQEENRAEHPGRGDKVQQLIESYNTKARWQKAIFRLRDEGKLNGEMKDLKQLIPEVQTDILVEDLDEIKNKLASIFMKDLQRHSVKGLPEFYQDYLISGVYN